MKNDSLVIIIILLIVVSYLIYSKPANSQGYCYTVNNTTICNSSNNRTETIIKGQGNTSYIYDNTVKQRGTTYPNTIGDTRSNDYSNPQKRYPFTR
jgi:hypothetical protein